MKNKWFELTRVGSGPGAPIRVRFGSGFERKTRFGFGWKKVYPCRTLNSTKTHHRNKKHLKTTKSEEILNVQNARQNYRSPVLNLPKNLKLHKRLRKKRRRCFNRRRLFCLCITLTLIIICIIAIILILFLRKSPGKEKTTQISLISFFIL